MRKCTAIIVTLFIVFMLCSCKNNNNLAIDSEKVPDKYLPIGSVVLLVNGTQPLMIYARAVEFDTGEVRDYSAVLYPYGYLGSEYVYSFNHADIAKVLHWGYVNDDEEMAQQVLIEKAR